MFKKWFGGSVEDQVQALVERMGKGEERGKCVAQLKDLVHDQDGAVVELAVPALLEALDIDDSIEILIGLVGDSVRNAKVVLMQPSAVQKIVSVLNSKKRAVELLSGLVRLQQETVRSQVRDDEVGVLVEFGNAFIVRWAVEEFGGLIRLEKLVVRAREGGEFVKVLVEFLRGREDQQKALVEGGYLAQLEELIEDENEDALQVLEMVRNDGIGNTNVPNILVNLLVHPISESRNEKVVELLLGMVKENPAILTARLREMIMIYEDDDGFPLLKLVTAYLDGFPENGNKLAEIIAGCGSVSDAVIDVASFCVLMVEQSKMALESFFLEVLRNVSESSYCAFRFFVVMCWNSEAFCAKLAMSETFPQIVGYVALSKSPEDVTELIYFLFYCLLKMEHNSSVVFKVFALKLDLGRVLDALEHVEISEESRFGNLKKQICEDARSRHIASNTESEAGKLMGDYQAIIKEHALEKERLTQEFEEQLQKELLEKEGSLRAENSNLRNQLIALQAAQESHEKETADLQEQLSQAEQKCKNGAAELKQRIRDLESQLQKAEQENFDMNNMLKIHEAKSIEKEKENKLLRENLTEEKNANERLRERDQEIRELKSKLQVLEGELHNSNEKGEQSQAMLREKEQLLKTSEAELSRVEESNTALDAENSKLREKVALLEQNIEAIEQSESAPSNEVIQSFNARIKQLESDLQLSQQQQADTLKRNNELVQSKQKLNEEVTKLQQELAASKATILEHESSSNQITTLQERCDEKDKQIQLLSRSLQDERQSCSAMSADHEQQISSMTSKIDELSTELDKQKQENEALKQELSASFEDSGLSSQLRDHEKQLREVKDAHESIISQMKQEYSDSMSELRAQNNAISKREMEVRDQLARLAEEKETLEQTITELSWSINSGYEQKGLLVLENENLLEKEQAMQIAIAQKDEEIQEKDQRIKELEHQNNKTESQLSDLEHRIGTLTERFEEKQSETIHETSTLRSLEHEVSALRKKVRKQQAKLKKATAYKRKVKSLTTEVAAKDTEIASLKQQHAKEKQDMIVQLSLSKTALKEIHNQRASIDEGKLRIALHEGKVWKERYEELLLEAESLRDRVKFLDERNDWKNREISTLKEESEAQTCELSAKIEKQKAKIRTLKQAVAREKIMGEAAKRIASPVIPTTSDATRDLRIKLIRANETNKHLRSKVSKLEQDLRERNTQSSEYNPEADSMRITILKLKEERREMRQELDKLKKRKHHHHKPDQVQQINDEIRRMSEEKQRMKQKFESQLDDLDHKIEHLSKDTRFVPVKGKFPKHHV